MVTIFAFRSGRCEQVTSLDRSWLNPASGVVLWVDLESPSIPESLILSDSFAFHPLAVEDAMSSGQPAKIEAYDGHLFAVLRGPADGEVDFFVGPTCLVTVHHDASRAVADFVDNAKHSPRPLVEGPVALFHRIVDALVDGYGPALDALAERAREVERQVFDKPSLTIVGAVLSLKRDLFALWQNTISQRMVVERLARREFVDISTDMAFRFRDIQDHLVRVVGETEALQNHVSGLLMVSVGVTCSRRWL